MARSASIIVCGLPESGKTTYLAALWHILGAPEVDTALTLSSREYDDYAYIRSIHQRWLRGHKQIHTQALTQKVVGLDLADESGNDIQLLVPDHSGETYQALWAQRQCETNISKALKNRAGIMVFINVDTIEQPRPLINDLADADDMAGDEGPAAEKATDDRAAADQAVSSSAAAESATKGQPFNPADAPDQVKLVDILQSLRQEASRSNHRRVAIILSAWDLLAPDEETPEAVLKRELPLLHDYLETGEHEWETKVYGVSAQGGEYADPEKDDGIGEDTQRLLEMRPSERITIVDDGVESRDLTLPIAWLSP